MHIDNIVDNAIIAPQQDMNAFIGAPQQNLPGFPHPPAPAQQHNPYAAMAIHPNEFLPLPPPGSQEGLNLDLNEILGMHEPARKPKPAAAPPQVPVPVAPPGPSPAGPAVPAPQLYNNLGPVIAVSIGSILLNRRPWYAKEIEIMLRSATGSTNASIYQALYEVTSTTNRPIYIPARKLDSYYNYIRHTPNRVRASIMEMQLDFLEFFKLVGPKHTSISRCVPGSDPQMVKWFYLGHQTAMWPEWSYVETQALSAGVVQYRHNWALIKDPIFGRSIEACQRRYEILNRNLWDANPNSNLVLLSSVEKSPNVNQIDWSIVSYYVNNGADSVMCEVRWKWLNAERINGVNQP